MSSTVTNAYFPFGATMLSGGVAEVFGNDRSGTASIGHGYTCSGHPVGAAAALACLAETKRPVDKRTPVAVQEATYRAGVMIRASGPNIILSPPLICTAGDIGKILAALDVGLGALGHADAAAVRHPERSLG